MGVMAEEEEDTVVVINIRSTLCLSIYPHTVNANDSYIYNYQSIISFFFYTLFCSNKYQSLQIITFEHIVYWLFIFIIFTFTFDQFTFSCLCLFGSFLFINSVRG